VSYTFLQNPHSFKRFSILEEKCCADIINGWRQKNNQQIFSVRQILKKSTQIFFVHAKTKNVTLLEDFFSCCMTSFVAKKQFGTGVPSFFKLIEETDSQRQIHFCAGAWLEFKRFWCLKRKKNYCACINAFLFKCMQKSKWETAKTRGNLTFLLAIFWEDKIKLCIMTACMLSALRKQHVCDVKKNCNSNIFTRNCWKTTHRWSWMLL
jgi:hypothetical protein